MIFFYKLVNDLYNAGIISDCEFISNLIPDQSNPMKIRKVKSGSSLTDQVYIDSLPEDLRSILKKIGEKNSDINSMLLNEEFKKFKILRDLITEKLNDDLALKMIIDEFSLTDEELYDEENSDHESGLYLESEYITGWVELILWCLEKNKLKVNLPIITKGPKPSIKKIVSFKKEQFFIPFDLLQKDNRKIDYNLLDFKHDLADFEEIFPNDIIINPIYFKVKENALDFFNNYDKVFITSLPFYRNKITIKGNKAKFLMEKALIGEHTIESEENNLVTIPFWKKLKKDITNDNKDFLLIFEFIILLVQSDKYWLKKIEVNCEQCNETHIIRNSAYLSNLIYDSWVPIEENLERALKVNLDKVIPNKEFSRFLKIESNRIIDLLSFFGYDVLDMVIKKKSEELVKTEREIRDQYSKYVLDYSPEEIDKLIVKAKNSENLLNIIEERDLNGKIERLITENEGFETKFEKFIGDLEEKGEDDQVIRDNAEVGKLVEVIVKQIFKEKKCFNVETRYIGRDMEIWPNKAGWDMGRMEIPNFRYDIEIKFTSIEQVHISTKQSERANKRKEDYFILVVENDKNLRTDLLDLQNGDIPESIKREIIYNSHIIDNISIELGDWDESKVVPVLKGYWIKKKLYERKQNIDDWINTIVTLAKSNDI